MQSTFLPAILLNVHRFKKSIFTVRLSDKFLKNMAIENFTTPQMCSYTLPFDLSLITTLVWKCRLFSDVDVLQGSVATRIRSLRCDWIFNNRQLYCKFPRESVSVEEFRKSVKVWWSYSHEFGVSLLRDKVCIVKRGLLLVSMRRRGVAYTVVGATTVDAAI